MVIAILTAAGLGTRMNSEIPKQFMNVENKPIIIHTLEQFQNHPGIDAIVLVTIESWSSLVWAYAKQLGISKLQYVIPGGCNGQESIKNGLDIVNKIKNENKLDDIVVMIHDGNRPMVSHEIISNNLATYYKNGNAVTAIPCTEVVFVSDDGKEAQKTIPREMLYRTQTPHTFSFNELYSLHLQAEKLDIKNTAASCSLCEVFGKKIYFSKGSELNFKITTSDDLTLFRAVVSKK